MSPHWELSFTKLSCLSFGRSDGEIGALVKLLASHPSIELNPRAISFGTKLNGSGDLFFSRDGGEHFNQIDTEGVKIKYLIQHPYDKDYAYAMSDDLTHFRTVSSGKVWKKFTTPEPPALESIPTLTNKHYPLSFHGHSSGFAIFAGRCLTANDGAGVPCERQYYYTKNNFDGLEKLTKAHSCVYSAATPDLGKYQNENLVTCIVDGGSDASLVLSRSSDYFGTKSYVTHKAGLITDISKLGAGSHYLIAVGSHLSDRTTSSVYVSYNGFDWDKVDFPTGSELSSSFSIVESTSNSLFVDVEYPNNPEVGQLFNSIGLNGSYFVKSLDYTNRDSNGNIDYEAVESIDGVVLANVVANGKDVVASEGKAKSLKSKISFNQGNTWMDLQADGQQLNLHSIVQRAIKYPDSPGKYYSSPVPGLLLGVGNTGSTLDAYDNCDTFISRDAGLTWSKTLNGPHLFEFGDQGSVILAIEDNADTNALKFTTNQGRSWQQASLDSTIKATLLTSTPDSTTFKFLLGGFTSNGQYKAYGLNFNNLYDRKCGDSDFDDWFVKDEQSNQPMCFMGHKQRFKRRISDANCFVGDEYKEPVAVEDSCPCTEADYVCSYNFKRDASGKCVPAVTSLTPDAVQKKECVDNAQTYFEPSAYTIRPGSVCSVLNGVNLNVKVEKTCPNFSKETDSSNDNSLIDYDEDDTPDETAPDTNPDESEGDKERSKDGKNDGRVRTSTFVFDGSITKYAYLDRVEGSNLKDETIVLLTSHNKAYVTHDQGSSWEQIAPEEEMLDLIVNPYNTNHVYLLSTNQKIIYSTDRADNWKFFRTPANFIPGVQPLQFHPKHSNWFIYIGQLGCESMQHQGACKTVTYYTKSYGKRFAKLQDNVQTCKFIGHLLEPTNDQLIICEREENENTIFGSELLVTEDFFENTHMPLDDVVGFAQADDYLVAATAEKDGSLIAHVSVNGKDWTDALFPDNFKVNKNQAYTVLSASSHAVFLHVTTNDRAGSEFGTILKSNSNGTYYVITAPNVNRDANGFVDFERLNDLEGVSVMNTVSNVNEARRGSKKTLKSMITHNDGADWDYLQPPSTDSEGKKYSCKGKSLDECSLHLHGYTERDDPRDTFSSGSAIGMMIGVGNVGNKLDAYFDGSTFLTRDGGVTWKEIKKGVYQWEYGDQGSIIVLVNAQDSTNVISYSLDEGQTWSDYQFTESLVKVNDISTVPSDDSRKFLLFTKLPSNKGDKSTVYQIDFSQLLKRKCNLDLANPDTDDFDLWTPKHPHHPDNCLFGHEAHYYKKIPGRDCYIGEKLSKPYEVINNCPCNRKDFECDWNYEKDSNGECKLISGYTPPDHSDVCKKPGVEEYWLATGYRRIPLTTCEGGQEFDKVEAKPCAGKEAEFKARHKGLTGLSLALVIIIPILTAATFVYFIYYKYVGKYGQIKLGDEDVQFDNTSIFSKISSITGFVIVRAVSITKETTGTIFDWISSKVLRKSVSLESNENVPDIRYTDLPENSGDQTDIEDDILDEGDLTEAEDDRV
ncbi:transmembrane sorting receptor [Wickerhamomyces ciferrii]|uniref:Transmembrane sorting receptor n=1 Tax=Wickerhamomyces ciferrii (strain ATCC 14091 / BCRC 22168 / CBS 111 / JCM 3599 / NBRC 0793 / NRRL Y-1031 F-60-10) TaxID=1206466 RepID=K0KAZ9_WICCF|nr:transmembrane sorting receptor [Wickerhamomyces ciferrii]CCH42175.1 transmembrane sorting receptor [Wickerhamomyces ciferrii]